MLQTKMPRKKAEVGKIYRCSIFMDVLSAVHHASLPLLTFNCFLRRRFRMHFNHVIYINCLSPKFDQSLKSATWKKYPNQYLRVTEEFHLMHCCFTTMRVNACHHSRNILSVRCGPSVDHGHNHPDCDSTGGTCRHRTNKKNASWTKLKTTKYQSLSNIQINHKNLQMWQGHRCRVVALFNAETPVSFTDAHRCL